jgi:hypothetical protein
VYCHCGDRYIGKYFVAMVDDWGGKHITVYLWKDV